MHAEMMSSLKILTLMCLISFTCQVLSQSEDSNSCERCRQNDCFDSKCKTCVGSTCPDQYYESALLKSCDPPNNSSTGIICFKCLVENCSVCPGPFRCDECIDGYDLIKNDTGLECVETEDNTTSSNGTDSSSTTVQTMSADGDDDGGASPGVIAGSVVGAIVLIVVIAALAFWFIRRRRKEQKQHMELAPKDYMTDDEERPGGNNSATSKDEDGKGEPTTRPNLESHYSIDPTSKRAETERESSDFYGLGLAPPPPTQNYEDLQFSPTEENNCYNSPQVGPSVEARPSSHLTSPRESNRGDSVYGNAAVLGELKAASDEMYANTQAVPEDEGNQEIYCNEVAMSNANPSRLGPSTSIRNGDVPVSKNNPASLSPHQSFNGRNGAQVARNSGRLSQKEDPPQEVYMNNEAVDGDPPQEMYMNNEEINVERERLAQKPPVDAEENIDTTYLVAEDEVYMNEDFS